MKQTGGFYLSTLILLSSTCLPTFAYSTQGVVAPDFSNQGFRQEIIQFIHAIASHQGNIEKLNARFKALDEKWGNVYQTSNWTLNIIPYVLGTPIGIGKAHSASFATAVQSAVDQALQQNNTMSITSKDLKDYRFEVSFDYYPSQKYAFIEFNQKGYELTGSRVCIRTLDTHDVDQQIELSKGYLLRNINPEYNGFFKFYDAKQDKAQRTLRTIYSASSLLSLLKINAYRPDASIRRLFKPIATFILTNQSHEGPSKGGFAYDFNPKTQQKSHRFIVGTTSKTIFTLLALHQHDPKETQYLNAAKDGGDWLLTMIEANGRVNPILTCNNTSCVKKTKQSLLYSGQVLSALSRLYAQTHDKRYHEFAHKIATHFLERIKKEGLILGDDYRPANSISSSWVMMSLIDFSKVDSNPKFSQAVSKIANALLLLQIKNKHDVFNHGRYLDAMTTSGNGWLNEVFGEYYTFCEAHALQNCTPYRTAIIRTSRWLLQNAYNEVNSYRIKNPARAMGGFMTNFSSQTVRTDAVCHGVNSLLALLKIVGPQNQVLIDLPERPLAEIMPLIRAGNKEE